MKSEKFKFTTDLASEVFYRLGDTSAPWALLLHGYGQTGEDILNSLLPVLPSHWNLAAPNGAFPFYSSKQKKLVAAWFFFDAETRKYLVGREASQALLRQWMRAHLSSQSELFIFGYSQGAYMAPFVGLEAIAPKKVILLNGRIRHEELMPVKPAFPILSINGEKDAQVEVANCIQSADLLRQQGWQIDLKIVAGAGHELEAPLLDQLKGYAW